MKTMLQLLLVMLVFGGAATAGTLYWQKQQTELQSAIQRAEAAEAKASENPLADLDKKPIVPRTAEEESSEPTNELPVAVRPPFVEGADENSQLVVSLNQRLRATQEKERVLNERQEVLKLIFADIRSEQAELNRLRQDFDDQVGKSSQSAREALNAAQDERDRLRKELDSQRSTPAKSDATPADGIEASSAKSETDPAALKRLAAIYDGMPAEVVADVLQQLGKQGRDADAVQILKSMKERQAAKVLATIAAADAAKAASLTEKLKRP